MPAHHDLNFSASTSKPEVLKQIKDYIQEQGFTITLKDDEKPWGAYYYVDEKDNAMFAHLYFKDRDLSDILNSGLKLTPKFLIVAPDELLSWQWHERRGELWNLIAGEADYKASLTDREPQQLIKLHIGKTVTLGQGERHRLIGSTSQNPLWGIVSEIWQHTDTSNPSNEEDNHRVKDKYLRK